MSKYDEMEAGRDLDALIATKVMGWQSAYGFFRWEQTPPSGGEPRAVPRYSTDIAAAWQVVEKMRAVGHTVCIDEFHLRDGTVLYGCYFHHLETDDEHYAEASTVPLAICYSALCVVGAHL